MPETICVNSLLFIGICTMAAIGTIRAAYDLWEQLKPQPSPFDTDRDM